MAHSIGAVAGIILVERVASTGVTGTRLKNLAKGKVNTGYSSRRNEEGQETLIVENSIDIENRRESIGLELEQEER